MDISEPNLIEPGIYTLLKYSLKQCHTYKWKYYNYLVNIFMGIGFILFVLCFCWWHYKGVPNEEYIQMKKNTTQMYILQKIKNFQHAKQVESQELITSLPRF